MPRRTARILPVDGDGRVLLLFGRDPAIPESPCWFTVGGGIEDGESDRDAAVREMFEETGIRVAVADLLGPFERIVHSYSYAGEDHVSDSAFFAVGVVHAEVARDGLDEDEATNILNADWWSPEDLIAAPLQPDLDLFEIVRVAAAIVKRARAHSDNDSCDRSADH